MFQKAWRNRARLVSFLAVVASGLLIPGVNAQVINYPSGFAGSSGKIWLENAATLSGSLIHLVPSTLHNASNAWYEIPQNVQAFNTTFTFHVVCPPAGSGTACGDGFGFMIISDPNNTASGYTYSGFSGGQFSWSQCQTSPTLVCPAPGQPVIKSILVKFDLYGGSTSAEGNYTGFYSGGEWPRPPNPEYDMAPSGINMQSGDLFSCTISYNGTVVTETVTDTVTGATYTNSYTANIPSLVAGNSAFIGFGGGTGAALDDIYLHSWSYTVESPGQAAAPTFSPGAGTYSGSQSVQLSTTSSGAVICYNTTGSPATNGSGGCAAGTQNVGPVTVSSSETLYSVAGGTGYEDSPVASASYIIQSSVATPTFSPAAGTYNSPQQVSISDAVSNATIYYTTNGMIPTTSSTRYDGSITVSSTEKLEAIAAATGDANSAVASAVYTITSLTAVAAPTFSPATGVYGSAQLVTISDATPGAMIYYTTDGTMPTTSSTEYTGAIPISSTETVEAIAVAPGDTNSAVASAAYSITPQLTSVSAPTFSPGAGSYGSAQLVTISDATSEATIYYTTDGTTPTTSSTEYSGPITVSSTETLEAIAVASGKSAAASAAYTISPQPNFVLATSATSLMVNAGGHGTVMLTVTSQNGFDSPVSLACSGLPAGAACSFGESTVTPSGGETTTALTIFARGQSSALPPTSRPFLPLTSLALTVGLFGWRMRRGGHGCLLLAACAGLGLLFGCGGTGGSGGASSTSPVAPMTSTIVITATSGSLRQTAAIAFTVN